MNVVDSSGWLEFFGNGANADFFAGPLAKPQRLIVPALSIFGVFTSTPRIAIDGSGNAVAVWVQNAVKAANQCLC